MSTPLAVLFGPREDYLEYQADKASNYLRSGRTKAFNVHRRCAGATPTQLLGLAVIEATEIRTGEEIVAVCLILEERGVVP